MKNLFISIYKNKIELFFLLILLFYTTIFYKSFFKIVGDGYAFNELFLNYETGFIRRGFLGQIFYIFFSNFNVSPFNFFGSLFIFLYLIYIFFFYLCVKKWKNNSLLSTLVIFSPALILFSVYDENVYFVKDIFIKISIFIHAFFLILILKKELYYKYYNFFLLFILIPLIFITCLIHELQIIFIPIHLLFTYAFLIYSKKEKAVYIKYFKYYLILLVPFILLIIFRGNKEILFSQSQFLLNNFGIQIHPQLGTGITGLIGGFYVWHFYYFDYSAFINLFFSFILSFYIFYLIIHYLISIRIITLPKILYKHYFKFFFPCFISFFLTDHGRTISLLANHLIAFYFILKVNEENFIHFKKKIKSNLIVKQFLIIFCFFYIFLWYLSQTAGLGIQNHRTYVFSSSLFSKVNEITRDSYYLIRNNIFYDLPDIEKIIFKK
jgi:hypothetical protein